MPNATPAVKTSTKWISRAEAAKHLGLSTQTLANNRATGPKYAKLFGSVRYHLDDLDTWARQRMKVA